MTIVTSSPFRIDMQGWGYLGLRATDHLTLVRWTPERSEVALLSDFDRYSAVSVLPRLSYVNRILLHGTGFGDFDARGVPHAGILKDAQLANEQGFIVYLDQLNMSAVQFIDLLSARDGALLRSTLLAGNDVIEGGYIEEGFGPGVVLGDYLLGDRGDDTISGNGGHDTIDGGDGDDFIRSTGEMAASRVDGGPGLDTASYDRSSSAVTVDLATGLATSAAGRDTLSGVERVVGSLFDDRLGGSSGNDGLQGLDGADTINGAGGSDTINGDDGAGYLRGDAGDDLVIGGRDFDDINGNMGNDTAFGGFGDDWVVGGKDSDVLFGGVGADLVYGNLGADTCDGGDGADIVRGGQDSDVVRGGTGDDFVSGDKGDDTMTGGEGADLFHTFGDAGIDRVLDFSLAEGDRVLLDPGTQFTTSQVGADTVISMTGGGQVILVGVQMSTLTPGWIFGA